MRVNTPWSEVIPQVQWILNRRTHSALGLSPAELLFGMTNAFRTPDPTGHLIPFRNRMEIQDVIAQERLVANVQKANDREEIASSDNIAQDSRVMVATRPQKKNPNYVRWVGPGLVMSREGDRLEVLMPGEAKARQVFIGNVKKLRDDAILEDEDTGDHPNEIVEILDHEPKSNRKGNILLYEVKVKYVQIPEARWIRAISIRDLEVFRKYANSNGLEHLLSS